MIDPSLDRFCSKVQIEEMDGSRNPPWTNNKHYSEKSSFLCLHREILDFVRWIQPKESEKHIRYLVVKTFRSAISLLWPNSKTICHGSTATETFLPNGDLDFCVVGAEEGDPVELLQKLCNHLLDLQIVNRAKVIHAKCPIIKCVEKPYNFNCDISIGNINGILNIRRNVSLMQTYKELYPLLMVLKVFLFQEDLDQPFNGGISSNTLIQLIVFILQSSAPNDRDNLGKLLIKFFKIFGSDFNYFTTGISTIKGGTLFSRVDTERLDFKSPVALSVEDPQVPGSFLGENAYACPKLRNACFSAYRSINTSQSQESTILSRVIETQKTKTLEYARNDLDKHYQNLKGTLRDGFKLSLVPRNEDRGRDRYYEKDRERDRNGRGYNRDREYRDRDRDYRDRDRDRDFRDRNFRSRSFDDFDGRKFFRR